MLCDAQRQGSDAMLGVWECLFYSALEESDSGLEELQLCPTTGESGELHQRSTTGVGELQGCLG
eukprot:2493343-Rhodomonas_salina.1